jgi:hypothetical protein
MESAANRLRRLMTPTVVRSIGIKRERGNRSRGGLRMVVIAIPFSFIDPKAVPSREARRSAIRRPSYAREVEV